MDQDCGNDDKKSIEIQEDVFKLMDEDPNILLYVTLFSHKHKAIVGLAHRYIVMDTKIGEWNNHKSYDYFTKESLYTILKSWVDNDLVEYDLIEDSEELSNVNKILSTIRRSEPFKLLDNSNMNAKDIKYDSYVVSRLTTMDIRDNSLVDNWSTKVMNSSTGDGDDSIGKSFEPILKRLELPTSILPQVMKELLHETYSKSIELELFQHHQDSTDFERSIIFESYKTVLEFWINKHIKDFILSSCTIYDKYDLMIYMHVLFQLNRFNHTNVSSEGE